MSTEYIRFELKEHSPIVMLYHKSQRGVAPGADTLNHKNLVHSWEAEELEEEEVERKLFQLETSRSPTHCSLNQDKL